MVQSPSGSIYTGITIDLDKRINEHNTDPKRGSKWCFARRPVRLVWSESAEDRSSASKREYQIKQLGRKGKIQLIEGESP